MPGPHRILGFIGMVAVGIVVPDVDLAIPFVPHRSGLTHSVLVPVVLLAYVPAWQRHLIAGMALGIAIALAADLFPAHWHWTGFATIHLPLAGSLGPWSPVWLAAQVVLACGLAHFLVAVADRGGGLVPAYRVAAPVAAAGYSFLIEHKIVPLLAFLVLWAGAAAAVRWLAGRPRPSES